jgi:hypothetical protein
MAFLLPTSSSVSLPPTMARRCQRLAQISHPASQAIPGFMGRLGSYFPQSGGHCNRCPSGRHPANGIVRQRGILSKPRKIVQERTSTCVENKEKLSGTDSRIWNNDVIARRRLKGFPSSDGMQEFRPEVGLCEVNTCRRLERMTGNSKTIGLMGISCRPVTKPEQKSPKIARYSPFDGRVLRRYFSLLDCASGMQSRANQLVGIRNSLWRANWQSGFKHSVRRTQRDHKPVIWRRPVDFLVSHPGTGSSLYTPIDG